jgi:hypothetical protein
MACRYRFPQLPFLLFWARLCVDNSGDLMVVIGAEVLQLA